MALETPHICTCGASKILDEQDQRRKLTQFLMGLDDSYSNARGQILMMSPLPHVAQAFALIRQDERQRQGYMPSSSSGTALLAYGKNKMIPDNTGSSQFDFGSTSHSGPSCYGFGSVSRGDPSLAYVANSQHYSGSHSYNYAPRYNPIIRGDINCSYCHKEGHLKEECFKLNGYPPGHPAAKWNKGKGQVYSQLPSSYKRGNIAGFKPKYNPATVSSNTNTRGNAGH